MIFNPNVGKYDVEADVGPSYGTLRQEAFNAFSQILAQNQQAFSIVGDFWAANADFPGAEELAERMKRGLPPQYKPGPPPELVQAQQQAHQLLGQADAHIAQLQAQLAQAQIANKDKAAENAINDYKAETERLKAVGSIDPLSLQVIVRQMVQDMLATELHPMLQRHAEIESGLQQTMAPPEPAANGQGGPVQ